ncbi:imidazole glycerol phosphate synthase subunit HisH [Hugenholtzia roseola]|uniref:imidazole glycerol phosphate synthase subunit HisH n=1 Tax=Hugenholtzia roseola TaxID=1002 RepID=UPI00040688D4|nr:imidazole glycerol phosphate synthase subunit HisH [Hugenholtzia roseola]
MTKQNIVIIDYKAGNIQSLRFALARLGVEATLSAQAEVLEAADKIIFPGVGHAQAAMQALHAAGLDTLLPTLKKPLLGICLGMQLLCSHSEEGQTPALAIFPTQVKRFPSDSSEKVPHMGWNQVQNLEGDLFRHIAPETNFYFVHSYYVPLSSHTIARCEYGLSFSAAIQKDNFFAVQFHPEKSGAAGEKLLQNFLSL